MPIEIALQLYTVREETSRDFLATCSAVEEIGYDFVELAGFGQLSPAELRRGLDRIGLRAIGSHIGIEDIENYSETIEKHLVLGCSYVCVAWIPEERRNSHEAWKETARTLNEAALRFRDAGLRLGYHNHAFEFDDIDGAAGWDILMNSANHLDAQVDVFWVAKGRRDPAETIRSVAGRVPTIHAKDFGPDGEDIELGSGLLDWAAIRSACEDSGVEFAIVEMDTPRKAPLVSAAECLRGALRVFSTPAG